MTVGVLALQGNFAEHMAVLQKLKVETGEVRSAADLVACDRLIIPGGESTVMARLLKSSGLWEMIHTRVENDSLPIFGTCAGAILLAKDVLGKNAPDTLGLLDIAVDRNAYGSQLQSFDAEISLQGEGKISVAFIRAPKITRIGEGVEVLAEYEGEPVIIRQGKFLASACHPEMHGETAMHRIFLNM